MKRLILIVGVALLLAFPIGISAHGILQDGHDGKLRPIDYIELGGVTLVSIGLIVYSLDQWRKDKKKKQ